MNKIDDCANSMNRVDKNSNDESSLNVHLGGIFFGKTAQCPPVRFWSIVFEALL